MSSAEPRVPTGRLPSPMRAPSRQTGGRGGLATIMPHNHRSPMSTSPSSPSNRRGSSAGPMPAAALLPRPSQEPIVDSSSYSTVNQRMHRNSPYGDSPTHRNGSLGPSTDLRLTRNQENQSPIDEQRHSQRPPPMLVHQSTSSSSNLSLGSGMSTASTSASSIYPVPRNVDDNNRPQLPPLSATGLHKSSGNMADYALRPSQPSSSGAAIPNMHHNTYQSSYSGSPSFSGMTLVSLIIMKQNLLFVRARFAQQPL